MSSKQLTASVRINTKSAEASLNRLSKKINAINNALNQTKTNNLHSNINKASNAANNVHRKIKSVTVSVKQANNQTSRLSSLWNKISTLGTTIKSKLTGITSKVTEWWKSHSKVLSGINSINSGYKKTGGLLSTIKGKLRQLADTYLGVMGMKAIIDTSDMITSAENKLNYISAQNLGSSGTNADGTYSNKTLNATQDAMDKMYASSQKVRMSYGDMMSNVSKSMALAGDAFDNNTDKAIRFQEIMAEAYAIGGASAQEMSSSMYQLIQALGSGTLAGDELRSVREGAPLAYKAIEEFAQGVYDCEDSLKDMASQGLITADMVTAAIMNSGNEMDKAFAQTEQTFAQTWEQIKNVAMYAFKPVSKMLREELNNAIDNGLIQKVETVFSYIAKGIMITFKIVKNVITWIADNWNWLKNIIIGVLIVYISYLIVTTALSIASAIIRIAQWIAEYWAILQVCLVIGILIAMVLGLLYVFYLFSTGAISACEAIVYALAIVGVAILLIGILLGNLPMIIIGAVLILLAVIFYFFEEVCYGAGWLAAWIVNIVFGIVNFVITCIYLLLTLWYNELALVVNSVMAVAMFIGTIIQWIVAFIVNLVMGCVNSIIAISHNCVAAICNVGMGLFNSLSAIAQNIGIAFQNAWIWAKNTFWEFIADVLEGVSKLEPVINGIAKLLGKSGVDFGGAISSARSKKGEYKSFVSVSDAWSNGMDTVSYKDIGDAWSSGWNTMAYANMGDMVSQGWNTMDFASFGDAWDKGMSTLSYVDPNAWGTTAGNWGAGVKNSINEWGSQFQNKKSIGELFGGSDGESGFLDKLGEKLGLDFGGLTDFPSVTDPNNDVSKLLGDDLGDGLGGVGDELGKIGGDTGKIADSMDLTEEDLEYLRKIAEMEWKKEYTTAEIKVDMSNYNTINSDSDLDGIVTKLADKLYDELNVVANGVYA